MDAEAGRELDSLRAVQGLLVWPQAPSWFLQKVDVTSKAVTEVLARTIEYLQPNPGRGTYQL